MVNFLWPQKTSWQLQQAHIAIENLVNPLGQTFNLQTDDTTLQRAIEVISDLSYTNP